MAKENRLYPEDQARVDKYLSEGIHSVERKPFKPLRLLVMVLVVVTALVIMSLVLTRMAGISV